MGTSSTRLFDDDTAATIRVDYPQYLRWGMTGRQATKRILDEWADDLEDTTQDAPRVWLALAVTQWKYGRLEPRVKSKALKFVKEGADIEAFRPEHQKSRARELEKIRRLLESPQPPPKPVRVRKPPEPTPETIVNDWTVGQVVAYRLDSGDYVLLATQGVEGRGIPYFLMLRWRGKRLPKPDQIRKLQPIKFAMGAYPSKSGDAVPWDRIERLDVKLEPIRYVLANRNGAYCPEGLHSFRWNEFEKFLGDNAAKLSAK